MTDPRYKVGSVSGYSIGKRGTTGGHRTFWYVLDRACCHKIVAEFTGQDAEQEAHDLVDGLAQKGSRKLLEPITTYLGYPIIARPAWFLVHERQFGTLAAARSHIKKLRRAERA